MFVIMDPTGNLVLICKALWTLLRGSLMHTFDPLCMSSDLPGVNPATLNGMILYCRLMTKWSGLGDSTELSRVGLSHRPRGGFPDKRYALTDSDVRRDVPAAKQLFCISPCAPPLETIKGRGGQRSQGLD
jgi:hypothetical protein